MIEEHRPYLPKNGFVEVFEIEEDNSLTCVLKKDKNLFVNTSFDIMVGALQGDSNKIIDTIAIGSGGIINSIVQTPNLADTSLYTETFRKSVVSSIEVESILTPNYIKYKFVIEKAEGNGAGVEIVNELGLFSADGTMFSRKTLNTEIIKTNEKALIIYWTLEF